VFSAGIVFNDEYFINEYTVALDMLTVSDDPSEQNTAYERIKHWIYHILTNAVMISEHSKLVDAYRATGQRVMIFPDDPMDQLVGIMLYLKLNSIAENRLVVVAVEIASNQGDDVTYIHQSGENLGPMIRDDWWLDARPTWSYNKNDSAGKIVSLDRTFEWKDFDLAWDDCNGSVDSSVVFANFRKDDTE
jgi:hypothetical protein